MGPVLDLDASMESMLATVDAATIERDPRATITPGHLNVTSQEALGLLRELAPKDHDWRGDKRFVLGKTIGEGGMGLVRLATQMSLQRTVAVKTLKEEVFSEHAVIKTLQEAWITGRLEHPNVLPVYDVGLDRDGKPLIVLKRIEGEQWADLMHDAERVRYRYGADDLLEWNIGILTEVCQALRFAHSRGIVHRDLKPENVMIGEFGEVYVLDWGIAVSTKEDEDGRIPLAKDAKHMAGTPCYMAPEMLGGELSDIGEHTDIYLVGSCLYEVLTGNPPHDGKTVRQIIASVIASPPHLPDSVGEELARILRRAMDVDPHARFENADQLRLALRGFLQHRGSRRLAAKADLRRLELQSALEQDETERVHSIFAECRFGYRAALEAWRDNPDARRSLREATIEMVRFELGHDDPQAAIKLLHQIDEPPPELMAEAERLRDSQLQARVSLERLEKDADRETGMRTRAFFVFLVGIVWIGVPLYHLITGARYRPATLGYASAAMLAFSALFTLWARESLQKTRVNRGLGLSMMVVFAVHLMIAVVARPLALDVDAVRVIYLAVFGMTVAFGAGMMVSGLWPVALGYAGACIFAAYYPRYIDVASVVIHSALFIILLSRNRALHWTREIIRRRLSR